MSIDAINLSDLPKEGKISRVLPDGYGYVQSNEAGTTKQYVFSFRAIPNYRGESVRELNLRRGTKVRFSARDSEVERIVLGPDYSKFLSQRGIRQKH